MDRDKLFQKNLELWAKTCPRQAVLLPYVNLSPLALCKTKRGEPNLKGKFFYHSQSGAKEEAAKWFKTVPLQRVPLVCVYGVGLGYYYDAIAHWLKKDHRRYLVFLEDDLTVIRCLLETERGAKILQDPQVQLLHFDSVEADKAIFEGLYWNFALTRLTFSALHSYAKNKPSILADLRHKIAYDAAMKNALVDEYVRYGANFYINFYQNMLCLDESYLGNGFFGKFHKVPAIICGAGPSLDKNLPLLRKLLDRAVVFAGGSALNVLNSGGFQPHFGAGIDPNPAQFERMSMNQGFEVPFFYRNRMFHKAFKMIHGPRLYITGSGGYDTAEFFEKKLGIEGGVLDEGHNVVNFCVEIAHAMGCDPIIFAGMDLAFTGMREYAPGVIDDAAVSESTILEVDDEDAKAVVKNDIYGKPTYTLWKWVAEADWIGDFAKDHPTITMVNCTEGGLGFPGIANRPLAEVADELLVRPHELKNRIHGETQNSALKNVTHRKIVRIMKQLADSLTRVIADFDILIEETKKSLAEKGRQQSGRAALAETELAEEPAYKYIIEVFNEVYAHLLSGDVHDIQVRRYSDKQRQLKRQRLSLKKFAFLRDVALANQELVTYAFKQRRKKKKKEKIGIEPLTSEAGAYEMTSDRLLIQDPELDLFIDEKFSPVAIPKIREDKKEIEEGHRLRVFFDNDWIISECYAEKEGLPNGQGLLFYPDGKTKEMVFYKKGKLHGPSRFWDQEGCLLAESWFINGRQQGKSRWYYPSGALYSLQRYKDNEWHGRQEFYYEDGTLKTLMHYDSGRLVEAPLLLRSDGTKEERGRGRMKDEG